MNRILAIVMMGLTATLTLADSLNTTPSSDFLASNYGDRNGVTLTNIIARFSTRAVNLFLDGGTWTITNAVTFPTNVSVYVTPGSPMSVATNVTLAFQGGELIAGAYQIFAGNGSATGTASFAYRHPVWGDFYAKDGKTDSVTNAIWNLGLTADDTDPDYPPSSGSICNHILVPDGALPEPGTASLALVSLGACAWAAVRRRRRAA